MDEPNLILTCICGNIYPWICQAQIFPMDMGMGMDYPQITHGYISRYVCMSCCGVN